MAWIGAFISGALFAIGLAIGGMTEPSKIMGFLDVFGRWDPSLLFVIGGAVGVNLILFRWILRRPTPLYGSHFALPHRDDIDRRVVAGSALFGIGWGLSGYCPGPAVASLATGAAPTLTFIISMLAGMALYNCISPHGRLRQTHTPRSRRSHADTQKSATLSRTQY